MKRKHSVKMSVEQSGDNGPRKSSRCTLGVASLPHDILQDIFSYLSRADVVNLASTNSQTRRELLWFVFHKVKLTWNDLTVKKTGGLTQYAPLITQLRIVDYYSYGEWQIDVFNGVLAQFENLTQLHVNSINSSNWLKYRGHDKLTHLSLYFDPSCNSTAVPHSNSIVSTSPKIFHLGHVDRFSSLTHLELNGYHFNWDPKDTHVANTRLSSLVIVNCTWEYPFDLSQFNEHESLHLLHITYSDSNPFILSERFTNFLKDPMVRHGGSLRSLHIEFQNYNDHHWQKLLRNKQLDVFMSETRFPSLIHLSLYGWVYNLHHTHTIYGKSPRVLGFSFDFADPDPPNHLWLVDRSVTAQHGMLKFTLQPTSGL